MKLSVTGQTSAWPGKWPDEIPPRRSIGRVGCLEIALWLLLDQGALPSFDAVRDLVRVPVAARLPVLGPVVINMGIYDRLLATTHA